MVRRRLQGGCALVRHSVFGTRHSALGFRHSAFGNPELKTEVRRQSLEWGSGNAAFGKLRRGKVGKGLSAQSMGHGVQTEVRRQKTEGFDCGLGIAECGFK